MKQLTIRGVYINNFCSKKSENNQNQFKIELMNNSHAVTNCERLYDHSIKLRGYTV